MFFAVNVREPASSRSRSQPASSSSTPDRVGDIGDRARRRLRRPSGCAAAARAEQRSRPPEARSLRRRAHVTNVIASGTGCPGIAAATRTSTAPGVRPRRLLDAARGGYRERSAGHRSERPQAREPAGHRRLRAALERFSRGCGRPSQPRGAIVYRQRMEISSGVRTLTPRRRSRSRAGRPTRAGRVGRDPARRSGRRGEGAPTTATENPLARPARSSNGRRRTRRRPFALEAIEARLRARAAPWSALRRRVRAPRSRRQVVGSRPGFFSGSRPHSGDVVHDGIDSIAGTADRARRAAEASTATQGEARRRGRIWSASSHPRGLRPAAARGRQRGLEPREARR